VAVTADLRDPQGLIRQLALGSAGGGDGVLRSRVPPGRWELEALELDEPTGLAVTNGHQSAESAAPPTQFRARVKLGPVRALGRTGGPLVTTWLGGWRAVGAASARPWGVDFVTSGMPGILRPEQPSDTHPVPVLVDPQTAAASGPGGTLSLTVDGLPVLARVAGVLKRFPSLASDASGFVVADEATLAAALDAQLPGQGRPDELWISSSNTAPLRSALRTGSLAQLSASFRADLEHGLRTAPIARGVLGELIAAAALTAALAALGLLTALLGAGRDQRLEEDLASQGVGPRGLRAQARLRIGVASVLGVGAGLAIAVLLTRLAVATVRASGTVVNPRPPLVTVVPWLGLAAWGFAVAALLGIAGLVATRTLTGDGRPRRADRPLVAESGALPEGAAR
jgi:hypothetical protein